MGGCACGSPLGSPGEWFRHFSFPKPLEHVMEQCERYGLISLGDRVSEFHRIRQLTAGGRFHQSPGIRLSGPLPEDGPLRLRSYGDIDILGERFPKRLQCSRFEIRKRLYCREADLLLSPGIERDSRQAVDDIGASFAPQKYVRRCHGGRSHGSVAIADGREREIERSRIGNPLEGPQRGGPRRRGLCGLDDPDESTDGSRADDSQTCDGCVAYSGTRG